MPLPIDRSTGTLTLDGSLLNMEGSVDHHSVSGKDVELEESVDLCELAHALRQDLMLGEHEHVSETVLTAPRRRHKEPRAASRVAFLAHLLYPSVEGSLSATIKYEKDISRLRTQVMRQRKEELDARTVANQTTEEKRLVMQQGPWREHDDPLSLTGPPALPMPVKMSDGISLDPFFTYLESNTPFVPGDAVQAEPYYGTPMLEFEKGVVYEDQRMDLCKKVLGPNHISRLMDALSPNNHIKHFLLGNNIIGPAGARSLARFIQAHPYKMETWYLAGNCIDTGSFHLLVDQMVHSEIIHSIWLKRNPLLADAAPDVARLITELPNLRTLDLDQTGLGDLGVRDIFQILCTHSTPYHLSLRTLYLNGVGIGFAACEAIARHLSMATCNIESLYLSCNPIGNRGCLVLAEGLKSNTTLVRLAMSSCGLKSKGAAAILHSLQSHPRLQVLDMGQSFATIDLAQRFNFLDSEVEDTFIALLHHLKSLIYLDVGLTAIPEEGLDRIDDAVMTSGLLYYKARSVLPNARTARGLSAGVRSTLTMNVQARYGPSMTYERFIQGPLRFVRNTEDVRYIDSVYRNRDMAKARRKLMVLKKRWDETDDTLERVAES